MNVIRSLNWSIRKIKERMKNFEKNLANCRDYRKQRRLI